MRVLEVLICVWLALSAIAHVHGFIPFYFHRELADPTNQGWFKVAYSEYGRVDRRYLNEDILIIVLQGFTAMLDTPLCLLLVYAIVANKWYRHFVQIVLCTAQAYGTVCFFIEGWKQQWQFISADPFDFWIEFVALNALWIVIPLLMLVQSAAVMRSWARSADSRVAGVSKQKKGR